MLMYIPYPTCMFIVTLVKAFLLNCFGTCGCVFENDK